MSVLVQKPIPVPTEAIPIRPSGRRNTSPFAQVIDGQRVYDHSPKPPDPDAIARLTAMGMLVATGETETDEAGHVAKVVLKREPRRSTRHQGPLPTYDVEECERLAATGQWTSRELAERYGVDPSTIRGRLRGRVPAKPRTNRKRILALYEEGVTVGGIHEDTGHAIGTIYRVLREADVEMRDDRRSNLSDEKRQEVLDLRGQGLSTRAVAREVGISPVSVRRIWKAAEDAEM